MKRNRQKQRATGEAGFTLAGVLIILTVMAVVLAYSVPRMWSDIRRRERDYQLVFVMEQYARAIQEFQRSRGALPVSLKQLEEQKKPRVLRQLYPNPLSGEVDWELVPPGAVQPGGAAAPGTRPGNQMPGNSTGNDGNKDNDKDTRSGTGSGSNRGRGRRAGSGGQGPAQPFIGVRPPQTGQAFISLKGSDHYEDWMFTIQDLAGGNNPNAPQGPCNPSPQNPCAQNPPPPPPGNNGNN